MKDSLLASSFRSLFVALFAMVGISLGFIPILLVVNALIKQSDDDLEIKSHYQPVVLANAKDKRKVLSSKAPVILKVNIGGFIGSDQLNTHTISEQLTESREGDLKNDRVKAVLVHINSPGGTVVDANGIYNAIKEYKERHQIPVYAYVDGLCASGGMYIAAACDKIFASEVSLIGSIGVLSPTFFNVTQLMDKFGIDAKTLTAGKGKDNLNPFRPWKPGEDDNLKSVIEFYYQQFVNIITSNRKSLNRSKLINEYGAHIFPAAKALEIGFIDDIGYSLDSSLKSLAKQIGVEDDYYQVVRMDRKISFSDLFTRDSSMMRATVTHKLEIYPGIDTKLLNQFLYLYLPSE